MDTYDFESKHIYRERRESAIDKVISIPIGLRRIAYLDTKEALDTISYLNRGYKAENLYAINNNPAELAHLTRKLDSLNLPHVNTVGLDFEDALNRRVPNVDVIDFDGMGNLSDKLGYMIGRITQSRTKAVFGITILAGRENISAGMWNILLKAYSQYKKDYMNKTSFETDVNVNHFNRLSLLTMMLNYGRTDAKDTIKINNKKCQIHITKLYWDVYISISNQPMLWAIYRCEPHQKLNFESYKKIIRNTYCLATPICCHNRFRERAYR